MMISTKGRYALRVMLDLAEHDNGRFQPLKATAERQEISEKYLEAVLRPLTQAGLLEGVRGKFGGYRLTRPVEQYTVGEILRLTENSMASVACLGEGASACPRQESCRTLPMWRKLDEMVNGYLDSVTLASLLPDRAPEE